MSEQRQRELIEAIRSGLDAIDSTLTWILVVLAVMMVRGCEQPQPDHPTTQEQESLTPSTRSTAGGSPP